MSQPFCLLSYMAAYCICSGSPRSSYSIGEKTPGFGGRWSLSAVSSSYSAYILSIHYYVQVPQDCGPVMVSHFCPQWYVHLDMLYLH